MEGVFKGSKSRGIFNASVRHDWNLGHDRVRERKAQLGKSKEASSIYDSAFVEPKKYSLKDDKDLNLNPSFITSVFELFTSYNTLYF